MVAADDVKRQAAAVAPVEETPLYLTAPAINSEVALVRL